jgi:hypothetical protein
MLVSADRREMVNKVQNDTDILQIEMQLAVSPRIAAAYSARLFLFYSSTSFNVL